MDAKKDYYAVLAVLPTADQRVVQAAYRALCKQFHPDVYAGADGPEKMKSITEAYEVLGDPAKRKKYDEERKRQRSDDSDFFNEDFDEEASGTSPLSEDWKTAVEYFPDLDTPFQRLKKINSRMAFQFQTMILGSKDYSRAEQIAVDMEKEFLTRFFGESEVAHEFALKLISMDRKDVLLELNRAIKVVGLDHSDRVVKQLCEKFDLKAPQASAATQAPQSPAPIGTDKWRVVKAMMLFTFLGVVFGWLFLAICCH